MEVYDEQYDICPYCGYQRGTPPEVASDLVPGTILAGRYIIGKAVGRGGFGITYAAWDETLGIKVAIKEFYPNGLVNRAPGTSEIIPLGGERKAFYEDRLRRFLAEARTMAKFTKEPSIVYVYGYIEENNTAYIVMEFMEGVRLSEYVTQYKHEQMPVDDAIEIMNEVGKALIAIHKEKIVHRDVAPDNIFICVGGKVKMYDFGASRLSSGEETLSMSVELKPGYAPPEQYRRKSRQGPRTDVYAFAATFYKLLTGKRPVESLDRMLEDTLEKPSVYNPEIPEWLDSVIMTGMAKNAEVRFGNISKFLEALNREKTVSLPEQRIKRRRWTRAVSVAVLALIISITGYMYFGMYSDISGEGVPDGKINVWVATETESDKNRYMEFDTGFEKKFKGKELEITYIDSDSYSETLDKALSAGKGPDVFMGNYTDNIDAKESVNGIIGDLQLRHYYLLKDNSELLKKERCIPMGFTMEVLYENTYLSGDLEKSYFDEGGADVSELSEKDELLDDNFTKTDVKEIEKIPYSDTAKQEFMEEKLVYYVGNVSHKSEIQKVLSGYSDVTEITFDGMSYGMFKDRFSINSGAEEPQKKIAKLMIKYGLSEEGQDILCVRNQGMIPLNKKSFGTFTDINESLSFMEPKDVKILN